MVLWRVPIISALPRPWNYLNTGVQLSKNLSTKYLAYKFHVLPILYYALDSKQHLIVAAVDLGVSQCRTKAVSSSGIQLWHLQA